VSTTATRHATEAKVSWGQLVGLLVWRRSARRNVGDGAMRSDARLRLGHANDYAPPDDSSGSVHADDL